MRSYLSALLFILSFEYSFTQHLVNESNYRILTDESYREYLRSIKFDEITTHFDTSFSLTVCRSPFHPCAKAMMFSYDHGIPKYEYYQNTTYQILGDLKCNCGLDNLSIQFPDNMPDGDYIYLREGTDIPLLKFSLRNRAYDKMHYQYYDNGISYPACSFHQSWASSAQISDKWPSLRAGTSVQRDNPGEVVSSALRS